MKFSEKRIDNPSTIEDALSNVKFQFDNVYGWLNMPDYKSALIKAECLDNELKILILMLQENVDKISKSKTNK